MASLLNCKEHVNKNLQTSASLGKQQIESETALTSIHFRKKHCAAQNRVRKAIVQVGFTGAKKV